MKPSTLFEEKDQALKASLVFPDFQSAFGFISSLAFLAEKMNHHPVIHWNYTQLDIHLSTHDAGHTVTSRDRTMAEAIDRLAGLKP